MGPEVVSAKKSAATQSTHPSAIKSWLSGIAVSAAGLFMYGYVTFQPNIQNVGWDQWQPSPGYELNDHANPRSGAHWGAGLQHPTFAHIRSSATVGSWHPDPGYNWASADSGLDVVWTPGQLHPEFAHIVSQQTPGTWAPQAGWQWANSNGDLRVVPVAQTQFGQQDASSADDRLRRGAWGLAMALVGTAMAQPRDDDGFLTSAIVRPLGTQMQRRGAQDLADAIQGR